MTLDDLKNLLGAVKIALECALIAVAIIAMTRASNSRDEAIEAWSKTQQLLTVSAERNDNGTTFDYRQN